MREKVVLIGAGSAMFTRGLVADVIRQGWEGEIALVDVSRETLDAVASLVKKMVEHKNAPLEVSATTDRREALPGATAVICTVGVGGRRAWEQDVFVPRKYGIFQPVGDTAMPGGSSRALRMIPAMVDIARDVVDLAPDALFFNYSNPMVPICRAIRKATDANVTGLCHGVHDVAGYLAEVLGVPRDKMRYTAIGYNHLTWFTELRVEGEDLTPRLREIAAERLGTACPSLGEGTHAPEDNPFSWQLTALTGAFPAVLDRHIIEFFPQMFAREGQYLGKTAGLDILPFEEIIAGGDGIFDEMCQVAASPDPLPDDYFGAVGGEHEQVTEIIRCLRSDIGTIFSANLPNQGQIPNLPPRAIVECPAIARGGALRPIIQEPLAPVLAGLLASRFQWVETIVDAALAPTAAERRELFIQALLVDGSVDSIDTAVLLADDLLETQAEYLP